MVAKSYGVEPGDLSACVIRWAACCGVGMCVLLSSHRKQVTSHQSYLPIFGMENGPYISKGKVTATWFSSCFLTETEPASLCPSSHFFDIGHSAPAKRQTHKYHNSATIFITIRYCFVNYKTRPKFDKMALTDIQPADSVKALVTTPAGPISKEDAVDVYKMYHGYQYPSMVYYGQGKESGQTLPVSEWLSYPSPNLLLTDPRPASLFHSPL